MPRAKILILAAITTLGGPSAAMAVQPGAAIPRKSFSQSDMTCQAMNVMHVTWNQTRTLRVLSYTRKMVCY